MKKSRLEEIYKGTVRPQLQKDLGISNILAAPTITNIVLNIGVKDAINDSKAIKAVKAGLEKITGQLPVTTVAKKSIAGFKLREGMAIGAKVTLRGKRAWEFLDRLINLSLPKVRDFQGVRECGDGRGGYNLGIKEWIIFPEIQYDVGDKIYGMNITINTTASDDKGAMSLLKALGMPFKKS